MKKIVSLIICVIMLAVNLVSCKNDEVTTSRKAVKQSVTNVYGSLSLELPEEYKLSKADFSVLNGRIYVHCYKSVFDEIRSSEDYI